MTLEEAHACYQSRKINRARRGFVHSFTPRYDATKKNRYVLIEIPLEPKERRDQKGRATVIRIRFNIDLETGLIALHAA